MATKPKEQPMDSRQIPVEKPMPAAAAEDGNPSQSKTPGVSDAGSPEKVSTGLKKLGWTECVLLVILLGPIPGQNHIRALILVLLIMYLASNPGMKAKIIAFLVALALPAFSGVLAAVVCDLPICMSERVALGILFSKVFQNFVFDQEQLGLFTWGITNAYTYYHVCLEFGFSILLTQYPGMLSFSGNWISLVVLLVPAHRTSIWHAILLTMIMRLAGVISKTLQNVLVTLSSLHPMGLLCYTISQELMSNDDVLDLADIRYMQDTNIPPDSEAALHLKSIATAFTLSLNKALEILPSLVGPLLALKDSSNRWRLASIVGVISYRFGNFVHHKFGKIPMGSSSLESSLAVALTVYLGTILFDDREGFTMASCALAFIIVLIRNIDAGPLVLQYLMDKLEGSPVPLSGEHTQALYQGLEAFADHFINSLHSAKTRLAGAHFEGKDTQVHIKQSFHSLLAIADEQFLEHVSAKPEPPTSPDAKANGTGSDAVDNQQNTQKISEKLKEAANISFVTCSKYIDEEAKLQAERGDRSTRITSVNSQSMFATFRSDLRLPPIIDSVSFKGDRFLGLCKNYQPTVASQASTTNQASQSGVQSASGIPDPILATSTIVLSPAAPQLGNTGAVWPPPASTSSVPRPPAPGGIPPPPPLSIDQLMAHSKKVDEARKRGEVPPPPPFSLNQLQANSKYIEANKANQGQSQQTTVEEDDAAVPQMSYKDQINRLLAQKNNPVDSRQNDESTSAGRSNSGIDSSADSSVSGGPGKKIKASGSLLMQSQIGGGISKASGFFDDDEDDGETLIKRSKGGTQSSNNRPQAQAQPPNPYTSNQRSSGAINQAEEGGLLDSILTKKKAPTVIDESNPFSSRPKRKNMLLLEDEKSEDEEADKKVNKKLQSLMDDSDDDVAKRKRLLDKYSSKTKSKDEPVESTKKPAKGKAVLQDSDEEPPQKQKQEAKAKPAPKFSDDEDTPKPKPSQKTTAAPAKKKVLQDSSDEEKPAKTKPAVAKIDSSSASKEDQPVKQVNRPNPEPTPAPKAEPPKKETRPAPVAPPSDEESSPPKTGAKRNMDFLSKLNSQLGQGPKEGAGLIKSVVIEDDSADLPVRKPSVQEEEEPSLLPQVYRSVRGSVDDKSSIKDLSQVYFSSDQNKEPTDSTKVRESMNKKPKHRDSVSETAAPAKKPAPPAEKAGPAMLRGNQKGAFENSSDEEKPKPAAPANNQPTMLRGAKKGAFENSSEDEKPKQQVVAPPAKAQTGPNMLRGNQKGAFENSSDGEPTKAPAKPSQTTGPAMLRGAGKGAFENSSDEEKPKPAAPKGPAPAMLRGNQKGAFENSSEEEKPSKPSATAKTVPAEPARKNKLIDSDDEAPKPKASKTILKQDSSDDDLRRKKKPEANKAKPAAGKKPIWGGDDSDDAKPKASQGGAKEPAKGGKRKLFNDDD